MFPAIICAAHEYAGKAVTLVRAVPCEGAEIFKGRLISRFIII